MDAAPSVWDPAARIKDQDRDGVQAEVITLDGHAIVQTHDQASGRRFRAYNDWAVGIAAGAPTLVRWG
jgi:hypothetical protein